MSKTEHEQQKRIAEMVSPMRAMQAKNSGYFIDAQDFKTKVDSLLRFDWLPNSGFCYEFGADWCLNLLENVSSSEYNYLT